MLARSYIQSPLHPGPLAIEGDEARHLARVRRAKPGDSIEVFDGLGSAYVAVIIALGRDQVEVDVLPDLLADRLPKLSLTLATAIPKGDRFDWLVEKATELGVARLIPIVTSRSVVDPRTTKLERLRRTVIEASKQCGRNRLMAIEVPISWTELAGRPPSAAALIAHPGGMRAGKLLGSGLNEACLAIGPEGGFTEEEVDLARSRGWRTMSLGPTILRIETACLVGAASIYEASSSIL